MTFGTGTESKLCTSLNPKPEGKCIFVWPHRSLNNYNIPTCSLPDFPYDALWKTTSIWWLINIFLTSSLLVISPKTYIWILWHKMRLKCLEKTSHHRVSATANLKNFHVFSPWQNLIFSYVRSTKARSERSCFGKIIQSELRNLPIKSA